jgi:cytochrome c553
MKHVALGICLLLACAGVQARGNAENGKQLAMVADEKDPKTKNGKGCAACHGEQGNKPSEAVNPILAGQHYDYLVRALTDYRIGRRNNPTMKALAGQLSKKEVEDLAAWFASQKSNLHDQR